MKFHVIVLAFSLAPAWCQDYGSVPGNVTAVDKCDAYFHWNFTTDFTKDIVWHFLGPDGTSLPQTIMTYYRDYLIDVDDVYKDRAQFIDMGNGKSAKMLLYNVTDADIGVYRVQPFGGTSDIAALYQLTSESDLVTMVEQAQLTINDIHYNAVNETIDQTGPYDVIFDMSNAPTSNITIELMSDQSKTCPFESRCHHIFSTEKADSIQITIAFQCGTNPVQYTILKTLPTDAQSERCVDRLGCIVPATVVPICAVGLAIGLGVGLGLMKR